MNYIEILKHFFTAHNVAIVAVIIFSAVILFKKGTIKDLLNSFNNKEEGWSARKLTAFAFFFLSAYAHYKGFEKGYIDRGNIISLIIIDTASALLAQAILKPEDIIRLKNGDKNTSTNTTTATITTTAEEVKS